MFSVAALVRPAFGAPGLHVAHVASSRLQHSRLTPSARQPLVESNGPANSLPRGHFACGALGVHVVSQRARRACILLARDFVATLSFQIHPTHPPTYFWKQGPSIPTRTNYRRVTLLGAPSCVTCPGAPSPWIHACSALHRVANMHRPTAQALALLCPIRLQGILRDFVSPSLFKVHAAFCRTRGCTQRRCQVTFCRHSPLGFPLAQLRLDLILPTSPARPPTFCQSRPQHTHRRSQLPSWGDLHVPRSPGCLALECPNSPASLGEHLHRPRDQVLTLVRPDRAPCIHPDLE